VVSRADVNVQIEFCLEFVGSHNKRVQHDKDCSAAAINGICGDRRFSAGLCTLVHVRGRLLWVRLMK
jgi:hypothetical protein